jgi:hypothetical protein
MNYYIVERIGDGTEENPFRPNFNGSYVWGAGNVCSSCNTYIIAIPVKTDLLQEITDLDTACNVRELSKEDVLKWFVGE